jgi:hypothetical protein
VLTSAISRLQSREYEIQDVIRKIYESNNTLDLESYGSAGSVIDAKFYYAHAAIRRLWTLLEASAPVVKFPNAD